jgi:hypothetical protein
VKLLKDVGYIVIIAEKVPILKNLRKGEKKDEKIRVLLARSS